MLPPEREQASKGLKVLAKKLMAGAKKADKKLAYTVKKTASVSDIKSILKDLDAEIEEIKNNTQQMYQDINR